MDEFSLIEQFFKPITGQRKDVLVGIGDDAACVQIPDGMDLWISTDTLVSGVHFLPQWDAYALACRAVMVNLSDMAAMAASPAWVTLALTLPESNPVWLKSFATGLQDSLNTYNVELIGGDTTRGPLSITLTIMGLAPKGQAVKRSGAKPGDIILVSGKLGAAALAVKYLNNTILPQQEYAELMQALVHPKPRVDLNPFLRAYASAAIDISDGLSADLSHVCRASNVGASLIKEAIPVAALVQQHLQEQAVDFALRGGDDYELCFTVAPQNMDALMQALKQQYLTCYPIGCIENKPGLRIKSAGNREEELIPQGYSHFRSENGSDEFSK